MAAAGLGLAGVTQAVELLARGLRLAARGRHDPVLRHRNGGRVQRDPSEAGRVAVFHLDIVPQPPEPQQQPDTFEARLADCRPHLRSAMAAHLERKRGACGPKTVSSLATRLAHFGRFLAEHDPELESLAGLGRQRHIEPYLSAVANAVSSKTAQAITVADQDRRIRAVGHMLAEITEWGWDDAPVRKLIFWSDHPRRPRPLPRYLPVDADRRLTEALEASTYHLAAGAHGPPRPRLSRDEPALRAPLRLHRPRRIRTRPRPGQGPHRRHAHTDGPAAHPRHRHDPHTLTGLAYGSSFNCGIDVARRGLWEARIFFWF